MVVPQNVHRTNRGTKCLLLNTLVRCPILLSKYFKQGAHLEEKTAAGVVGSIVVVIIVFAIRYNYIRRGPSCADKARNAAVDTYFTQPGLIADKRDTLEQDYEARYMERCN